MYEPPKITNSPIVGVNRRGSSTSLELVDVEVGAMTLDLDPGRCRSLDAEKHRHGLTVRSFNLERVIVEFSGPWPFELRNISARLERVGPGGFVTQLRCKVDYAGAVSIERDVTGVTLILHCEPKQHAKLRRYYREQRYPLISRGELDPREVVELFERSGYLDLRAGDRYPSERWCRASFSEALSSDVVYCAGDGSLLGHVSVTRAYSRSWLGHQLATLRGHVESFDCRVALYNHFSMVPALYDGDATHFLLGYYDRSRSWHQLFFEGFVDWHGDPSEAIVVPFDRFELLTEPHADPSPAANDAHPNVCVEQPTPSQLDEVVDLVHEQLPPLACAAFDINVDKLDRAYLVPGYAAHELPRGRRVFVVRERDEIVGVALCETGSTDVSLFDVLNLAQIFCRPEASELARIELVEFVRRYYHSLGCERPLVVSPPGSLGESRDLELVETMGCIVWAGTALPSYRRYLAQTFEHVRPESLNEAC